MQVCPRNHHRERSQRAVATALKKRLRRCGWCARCAPSGHRARVARPLGYGVESVRSWVGQADIDDGYEHAVMTTVSQRVKELEQEKQELKRANKITQVSGDFFGTELCANTCGKR